MTPFTYRDAGLDLDAYDASMAALPPLMKRTWRPGVFGPEGGFASLFDLHALAGERGYRQPVLVTSTDGVGSKLRVAQLVGRHDTVGIDLVAMSVNDCLCTGGEPVVFLDYLAMPADDPALTATLVRGVSDGCLLAGCALTGGETAILPDSYQPGDYDLAGFCVGVVERDGLIDGRSVAVGDVVVGLHSSGLHSNGYGLVRRVVFGHAGLAVGDHIDELGRTVGAELLEPTRIYVKPILKLLREPTLGPAAIHAWPTSPAAAWWTTCRVSCRRADGRCCGAAPGRCRRCLAGCNGWGRSPSRRWIASSTMASAFAWWPGPRRSRPCSPGWRPTACRPA